MVITPAIAPIKTVVGGGGVALHRGTVVPSQGFCIVRGARAPRVPDSLLVENAGNVVEVVADSCYCIEEGGGRLWFPNIGGWFAFYDANGVPQDAISWRTRNNPCMSCPPCLPITNECSFSGTLACYDSIQATRKTYITMYPADNFPGRSFHRIPDGGTWQNLPDYPTYATCNDICVDPPEPSCNAIAVAIATGGVPPYTYQWSDNSQQTTDTAFSLCAGTYTITVTDATMDSATAQVIVEDFAPYVSHPSYVYCFADSSAVLLGAPAGGTYTGPALSDNNVFIFSDSVAVYQFTYTITDTNGCSASADFSVTVNPFYENFIYDTICQREPYNLHGFHVPVSQTDSVGMLRVDTVYDIDSECDSAVVLQLFVLPSEIITYDTLICEGQDFEGYGLFIAAQDLQVGTHSYDNVYQNRFGCDSNETVNITVVPIYDIHVTENVCQGNLYAQNGFYLATDTMELGEHVFVHQAVSSAGCDSSFILTINVLQVDETILYDTICQYATYTRWNYNLLENEHVGNFVYLLNLQNEVGCDSIVKLHLVVTAQPILDFVSDPERIMFSDNTEIQFLNISDTVETFGNESFVWSWNFGDGNSSESPDYRVGHQYDTWGNFLVTLSVTTSFGCESSISHYVYVEADLVFPNILTPNGDNRNDVFAIKNLNPNLPNILTIYDRWGKRIFEKENYQTYIKDDILYNEEFGFRAENFSDGVYYYVFHYKGFTRSVEYHSSLTIIR